MTQDIKNSNSIFSKYAKGLTKILLITWIIIISYGFLTLIFSIVNLNVGFIWMIFFSNLLSLIPYAMMFFPTLQIFIILSDVIKERKFEGDPKMIKAFLTQFLIATVISLFIVVIFGANLTTNPIVEFFALFSLWIFFISLIAFLIYIFYSYFGEV